MSRESDPIREQSVGFCVGRPDDADAHCPAGAGCEHRRPVEPASGKILVSQTDYTLIDGVTESDIFLNTKEGNAQIAGFMTTIAPGAKATFKASYNGYYTEGSTPASRKDKAANLAWSMEKTTLQAANYTKATGGNVIMAMNGDYYNMQTLQPLGYLIMEGNLIQKNNGVANEPYFAVLKDGTFAIRDAGVDCSDVLEAISGPFYLIKDGQPCYNGNPDLMPRNCIGIKADGTVVTFLADGRQSPYSVGMTIDEEVSFLYAQGVVNAIFLDGGGSATCATKREGTTELQVRNRRPTVWSARSPAPCCWSPRRRATACSIMPPFPRTTRSTRPTARSSSRPSAWIKTAARPRSRRT